jgi:hypothetical protein
MSELSDTNETKVVNDQVDWNIDNKNIISIDIDFWFVTTVPGADPGFVVRGGREYARGLGAA